MSRARHIKLFRLGRDQAVRIPRAFQTAGQRSRHPKEGPAAGIESKKRRHSLLESLDLLQPLDEPFPEIKDYPPEPAEL
jgi:antitoxin VapB